MRHLAKTLTFSFLAIFSCVCYSSGVKVNEESGSEKAVEEEKKEKNDNFAVAFQEASKLRGGGKRQEAFEAFLKLAGRASLRRGKDEALGEAVYCAILLKNYPLAQEVAMKIQDRFIRIYYQVEIWANQRNWNKAMELLKDEDLTIWPDRFIYRVASVRGRIHASGKNVQQARKDFELAKTTTFNARQKKSLDDCIKRLEKK